ncbi:unnamed protein product [Leptidea sinapis]|uniref:Uncharacterized protein n=1 Tax=Leptidea sinapis TaxID=189913 RepID=A0A5E4QSR7_9NEOP|nr:unnamed protein product [Leptidea sinapis]
MVVVVDEVDNVPQLHHFLFALFGPLGKDCTIPRPHELLVKTFPLNACPAKQFSVYIYFFCALLCEFFLVTDNGD